MKKLIVALGLLAALVGCRQNTDIIVAYGRENNSGTYMYFKEHVLNDEDFAPHVQTLPGTAAVINAVSKDPRSIGYGGIGYAESVRVLKVKKDASSPAVEPTLENVVKGVYPLSRYLYFYTVGAPEGPIKDFIDWVRSDEGQKLCEEAQYFPLPSDKRVAAPPPPAERQNMTITIKGSDTMIILTPRWAEAYMKLRPGIVIQVTGGGSGTGIAALIDGRTHICMSSRPIKDKERQKIREKYGKEVVEFPVALDGLAVFVHRQNPLQEITLQQLKDIYTGKIRDWKSLGK